MTLHQRLLRVACLCFTALFARGQAKQPTSVITDAFVKMFPAAQKADWKDKTDHFTVFFTVGDKKCEAKFANNGDWQSTEMPVSLDSLPLRLTDSLKAGKYSDWTASSAYVFQFAKQATQYHLVVTKPEQGRKILFFSQEGQLLAAR